MKHTISSERLSLDRVAEIIENGYKIEGGKIIETDNFSKAALIFSISDSSKNSGKIGWINENSISNKIKEEISKNKIGQITNPIQIPGGFLILKLEDKREK